MTRYFLEGVPSFLGGYTMTLAAFLTSMRGAYLDVKNSRRCRARPSFNETLAVPPAGPPRPLWGLAIQCLPFVQFRARCRRKSPNPAAFAKATTAQCVCRPERGDFQLAGPLSEGLPCCL